MSTTIYNLGMYRKYRITNCSRETLFAMRVPGGWLFQTWDKKEGKTTSSAFVPYSEE